jgi:hypothetical protein
MATCNHPRRAWNRLHEQVEGRPLAEGVERCPHCGGPMDGGSALFVVSDPGEASPDGYGPDPLDVLDDFEGKPWGDDGVSPVSDDAFTGDSELDDALNFPGVNWDIDRDFEPVIQTVDHDADYNDDPVAEDDSYEPDGVPERAVNAKRDVDGMERSPGDAEAPRDPARLTAFQNLEKIIDIQDVPRKTKRPEPEADEEAYR